MAKERKEPVKAKEDIKGEGGVLKTIMGFNLTFWLFGFSGMAALIYEVVWTRALSLVLGSTTYALSTMLASFMTGLSLGGILGGYLADRTKNGVSLFIKLETGIAVSGVLVISLISVLPPVYARIFYLFHESFSSFSMVQFLLCFTLMLIPTTLMGATFPVVCKLNYRDANHIGMETGGVYAVNTVGAIIGALMAGFVLIPALGVKWSNAFAALINLSIAVTLWLFHPSDVDRLRGAGKTTFLIVIAFIASNFIWLDRVYPFGFYTAWRIPSYDVYKEVVKLDKELYKVVYNKENVHGNVKVIEMPGRKNIFINGKIESDTEKDVLNTSLLAYLPISLKPDAESFLSVGLGTGNTLHYASTIPSLKEIYSVEINPAVEEAVRLHFYPHLFKDRRARFITADARNYLMLKDQRYDIVSSEPSYPVDQGFSHLFSKEFFELVKSRLNKGGVFCQWVPTYLFNKEEMTMILKTFVTVFPNTTVWGVDDMEILFIGNNGETPQPVDEMKKRVDGWLSEQKIEPKYSLYLNTDGLDEATRYYTGEINTDDMPILEFYASRNMLTR